MKLVGQMKCLLTLALGQLCDRNTGPAGNDLGNLFLGHSLLHHGISALFRLLFCLLKLSFQLRQPAILNLRCLGIIAPCLRLLHLIAKRISLLLDLAYLIHLSLFTFPLCLLVLKLLLKLCQLLLQCLQTLLGKVIRLFL